MTFKFELGDRVSPINAPLTKGTVYSQIHTRGADEEETFEYHVAWDVGLTNGGWHNWILEAVSE